MWVINHNMKVASILEEARWGGPQSRLVQTAIALRLNNVDHISIIPKRDNNRLKNELLQAECKIREVGLSKLEKRVRSLILYGLTLPWDVYVLARLLCHDQIDIIHVQGGAWQIKGAIAGFFTRRKVVWHLNDTCSPLFVRVLFKILGYLSADVFVVQGQSVKNYYLTGILNKRRVLELFGIVDEQFFSVNSLKAKNSNIVAVTVGTITPTKGYDLLLDIAYEAKQRNLDVKFVVAGRVNKNHSLYYDELVKKQGNLELDNVEFIGECLDVKELLVKSSIYLCCSRAESSPTSVWEGMAVGLPVITTNVGNVSQVIRSEVDGYVCEASKQVITDYLEKLCMNQQLRVAMGKSSRIRIKELFSVKINGAALKSLYQSLV